VTWADFETNSALERDVLLRCLPLAATESSSSSRITIDMAVPDAALREITLGETIGPTPQGCVDLLQIRPLLTGTAWKVIDLLLETALDLAGEARDRKSKFSIDWSIDGEKGKVAHARKLTGRPRTFPPQLWEALMKTYVETTELRHSLVHRTVYTDPSGALVGYDRSGTELGAFTSEEQEALGRAALRAAQVVAVAPKRDSRLEADLTRQLSYLHDVHGVSLRTVTVGDSLPEITAIIDADTAAPGRYQLDLPTLRSHLQLACADLVVQPRDRPGQELRGRLEDAPQQNVSIDPLAPPAWLSS